MKLRNLSTIIEISVFVGLLLLTNLHNVEAGHTGFYAQTGRLLVASETIRDSRFAESVILLLQHNQSGSIGLVLNNRIELPLEGVPPEMVPGLEHIYFGGPVEPRAASVLLFGEHPPEDAKSVLKDLHVTGIEEVLELIDQGEKVQYRVFLGYSSWAPGQLEMELAHGVWRVLPADGYVSQENVDQLWDRLQERGPVLSL